MNSPLRHGMHLLQLPPNQPTATRSPTAKSSTPSPSSATVPAISWPSVSGHVILGKPPLTKPWSVPHTPQAATAMRTCPRAGGVVSTSTRISGASGDATWTALWVGIADLIAGGQAGTARNSGPQGARRYLVCHDHHCPRRGYDESRADAGFPGSDEAHRLLRHLGAVGAVSRRVHRVRCALSRPSRRHTALCRRHARRGDRRGCQE